MEEDAEAGVPVAALSAPLADANTQDPPRDIVPAHVPADISDHESNGEEVMEADEDTVIY